MIRKIVSGGQSGADRAALDTATDCGIPHGGWVPKGRMAEDGKISDKYDVKEMPTRRYAERTKQNVIDSDGTLIISRGGLTGGSELTRIHAIRNRRPFIHIDLTQKPIPEAPAIILDWIKKENIQVLNVAGPRASHDAGIYAAVKEILTLMVDQWAENMDGSNH